MGLKYVGIFKIPTIEPDIKLEEVAPDNKLYRYKLVFEVRYYGYYGDDEYKLGTSPEITRIIVAPDEHTAKSIATAMLGEEVNAYEYLERLVDIYTTEEKPRLPVYDNGSHTWLRVCEKLKINPDEVKWIEDDKTIIGFV